MDHRKKKFQSPEEFFKAARPVWRERRYGGWSFFCPQCRAQRKIEHSPRPRAKHYLQLGLTSVFFTVITWYWFSWKGMVSFVPFWIVFETIYRSRVRALLGCPHCGFDPFLYLVDTQKARDEIEVHWRKKFAEKGIPYPEKLPVADEKVRPVSKSDSSHSKNNLKSDKEEKDPIV